MTNPLLAPFDGPFGLPPFDVIEVEHFGPALEAGLAATRAEIERIKSNPERPTFENTIEALEQDEGPLDRAASVFFNLAGTDANPEIEALMREWSPKLAALSSEMMMDAALFDRVDALWQRRDGLGLTSEQSRVLELYHKGFVRAGARLEPDGKTRLAEIMQRLATLGTQFTQNVLADEREWFMALGADDLAGLPEDVIAAAKSAAEGRQVDEYAITLNRSLIVPFLQFSTRRDLRETAFAAWTARGMNGGESDTRAIAA